MRCEIYQDRAGGWRWRLRARNNRVIADGAEAYSERRKAADAVRDGRPTFFAEEAGHQLGTRATLADPGRCVSVGVEPVARGSRRPA